MAGSDRRGKSALGTAPAPSIRPAGSAPAISWGPGIENDRGGGAGRVQIRERGSQGSAGRKVAGAADPSPAAPQAAPSASAAGLARLRSRTLSLFSWPQAAMMSWPRGVRTGEE